MRAHFNRYRTLLRISDIKLINVVFGNFRRHQEQHLMPFLEILDSLKTSASAFDLRAICCRLFVGTR